MNIQIIRENQRVIDGLRDKDGLISTSELEAISVTERSKFRLLKHPSIEVFPVPDIKSVVVKLKEQPELWASASIDIDQGTIGGRAPIFGVPLRKAFETALRRGLQKSRFALLPNSIDPQRGFQADLLVYVAVNRKSPSHIREIEIWEDVRNIEEVFYAHSIVDISRDTFSHLDCATIILDPKDKTKLFSDAKKHKGRKTKHFRIDGDFPLTTGLDLMRAYFPVEELINETFETN